MNVLLRGFIANLCPQERFYVPFCPTKIALDSIHFFSVLSCSNCPLAEPYAIPSFPTQLSGSYQNEPDHDVSQLSTAVSNADLILTQVQTLSLGI